MTFRSILLWLPALAVLALFGCTARPSDPVRPQPAEPNEVQLLSCIAMNENSVKLSWYAPRDMPNAMYRIRWFPFGEVTSRHDTGTTYEAPSGSGSKFDVTLDRLDPELYHFTVEVMSDYHTAVSLKEDAGAPAPRHTMDGLRPGETLRLYEKASGMGSALMFDRETDLPTRVVPETAPDSSVLFVLQLPDEVPLLGSGLIRITVGSAVPALFSAGIHDPNLFIAFEETGQHKPFDEWYVPYYDVWFDFLRRYGREQMAPAYIDYTAGASDGPFILRTGVPGTPSLRYARVRMLQSDDRRTLQGTAPNRYVELEMSLGYRGVPFA